MTLCRTHSRYMLKECRCIIKVITFTPASLSRPSSLLILDLEKQFEFSIKSTISLAQNIIILYIIEVSPEKVKKFLPPNVRGNKNVEMKMN